MTQFWKEIVDGWEEIEASQFACLERQRSACSFLECLRLPMIVRSDFAFQIPGGVRRPV